MNWSIWRRLPSYVALCAAAFDSAFLLAAFVSTLVPVSPRDVRLWRFDASALSYAVPTCDAPLSRSPLYPASIS